MIENIEMLKEPWGVNSAIKREENQNLMAKGDQSNPTPLMGKKEEMRFFLREYKTFEGIKYDYYYIVPFKWIQLWDCYITDPLYLKSLILFFRNDNYPDKIDNSHLLDDNNVIKTGLI